MNEPAWIEHDGSAVCPVPAGHDVEGEGVYIPGRPFRNTTPETWSGWAFVSRYRDWTAFKQQEAMGKDVPRAPEWALAKASELAAADDGRVFEAFARYIAAHEQPPVDPIDRLRDAIEALHGIHFDRDKMEQIVRRAGIDSLAAAGEGE